MSSQNSKKLSKQELIKAIDRCASISEMFSLVRQENIDLRMQTLCSASCIPPKEFRQDSRSPEEALERLREAIRLAVENTR